MDETPTKWQKFKHWVYINREPLAFFAFVGTAVTGIAALAAADYKSEKKRIEAYNAHVAEFNTWLNDQNNSGNAVYQLEDGRYLVVDRNAHQETVIK